MFSLSFALNSVIIKANFSQVSSYMHEQMGKRERLPELGHCRRIVLKRSVQHKRTKLEKEARFSVLNVPLLSN